MLRRTFFWWRFFPVFFSVFFLFLLVLNITFVFRPSWDDEENDFHISFKWRKTNHQAAKQFKESDVAGDQLSEASKAGSCERKTLGGGPGLEGDTVAIHGKIQPERVYLQATDS